MLKIMLDKVKADQIQSEQHRYLGQVSEGMSDRDIKNWLAIAQKTAVARAVKTGDAASYCLMVEYLTNTLPVPVGGGRTRI